MWNIKCILHPTDFSQAAANAFLLARAVAKDYGAKLILLHTIEPSVIGIVPLPPRHPLAREEIEAQLQQIKADHPEITIEYRLGEGDPVSTILAAARETACDLIVMGTHGRTQLRRLLMGSVAENVLRNANCPVLTVSNPSVGGPVREPSEKEMART